MDKLIKLVVALQLSVMNAFEEKEKGATATEYAMLVAFIAFAVLAGATIFGNKLSGWFSDLGSTVSNWSN